MEGTHCPGLHFETMRFFVFPTLVSRSSINFEIAFKLEEREVGPHISCTNFVLHFDPHKLTKLVDHTITKCVDHRFSS